MLLVFDVNETLLDLSPLNHIFGDHRRWFDLLIRTATVRQVQPAIRIGQRGPPRPFVLAHS